MSRLFALTAFFFAIVAFSSAAPLDDPAAFLSVIKEYKDLIPTEVVEAYKSLTPEEKTALKEVFKNYKSYKNEQEVIAALKEKSPSLGEKAEKLYGKLQKKIAGLSAEPKGFVDGLIAAGRALHAQVINGEKIDRSVIKTLLEGKLKEFKGLSSESQEELKTTFPLVTKFLQDEKVQKLVTKFLEKSTD